MFDEFAELLGGFIGFTILLAAVVMATFFVGIVVMPIGLTGAGVLYYVSNIHLPKKRRQEAAERTSSLLRQAKELSPSWSELKDELISSGLIDGTLHQIAKELFKQEGLQPPVLPPVSENPIMVARFQDELERFIRNAHPDHFADFKRHLIWALSDYQTENSDGHMFCSQRQRSRNEIDRLILRFTNDEGLFRPLIDQLNANYAAENEIMPSGCKHDDYAWRYLKDTPLLPLRDTNEWVSITDRQYHAYLVGSSGSGKTNLIENIIAHDLRSDKDCCVVVIDSQTQLTEKLAGLALPDVTYITPKFDLALNLFDVGYEKMKAQGTEGETLINKTVGLLSFVMEGMMGAEFTNPQRTIFQYVIQLVISIPGGNINTFMEILANGGHENYADAISELDDNLQRFFTVDYPSNDYKRTREAIRRKLDSLLLNPTFRRLFSATENKIDMFHELESQKLIIIDTNKPMLDDAASAFFGRLFIAMILRASHMRFRDGRSMRPVFLVVDEAHEYFDKSISDMLEQARKANIGLLAAHQSLSQARGVKGGASMADPLMVNTATKLIWTSFREDAAKFAGSMQVKPEDILNLPQFTFGMYNRKRGFMPIRGVADALQGFERRDSPTVLKELMEERYGPTAPSCKDTDCPKDDPPVSAPEQNGTDTARAKPSKDEPIEPPEVEII